GSFRSFAHAELVYKLRGRLAELPPKAPREVTEVVESGVVAGICHTEARTEQFGGLLQANFQQKAMWRFAHQGTENASEMKRAHVYGARQRCQGMRLRAALLQSLPHCLDPLHVPAQLRIGIFAPPDLINWSVGFND